MSDKKNQSRSETSGYTAQHIETYTLVAGEAYKPWYDGWQGKRVRQRRSHGPCGFVAVLLKETPKLYIATKEPNEDSPVHYKMHLKKERFHVEPCANCPDY